MLSSERQLSEWRSRRPEEVTPQDNGPFQARHGNGECDRFISIFSWSSDQVVKSPLSSVCTFCGNRSMVACARDY